MGIVTTYVRGVLGDESGVGASKEGFVRQSVVRDSEGAFWIAREDSIRGKQRFSLVNDDSQGRSENKDNYLDLKELSRWCRSAGSPFEICSELSFKYLHGEICRTAGTNRSMSVELMAHQLRALAIFEGASRREGILIADEVGTGKTYSAGHILRHGLFHGKISRAIVLCPAAVADKWKGVLYRGFGIRCGKASTGGTLKRWLEGDDNGFEVYISSYDKGREIIDSLEESMLSGDIKGVDLVIFDEIHNLIGLQEDIIVRRRLADVISSVSSSRVGLTATPVWNDTDNLEDISQIIRPWVTENSEFSDTLEWHSVVVEANNILSREEFDGEAWSRCLRRLAPAIDNLELINRCNNVDEISLSERASLAAELANNSPFASWITRTRLSDISGSLARRYVPPADIVTPSDISEEIYDPVNEIMTRRESEKSAIEKIEGILSKGQHKLQLSSSPISFHSHLRRILDSGGIAESSREQALKLAMFLSNYKLGSKEKRLVEVLTELKENGRRGVVIFTRWRPTFDRLTSSTLGLEERIPGLRLYSASYSNDELRNSEVAAFKNFDADGFPVLVATRKMQEGIDLQQSADSIIHYDLPTNPQEVEQRIGRVDRIGQKSEIVEVRYILSEGKADHRNLQGMATRINQFESNVGGMRPIMPESFISSEIAGDVTDRWREGLMNWNLELVSSLDLRGFDEEFLPEGLDFMVNPDFSSLARGAMRTTISKILPSDTSLSYESISNRRGLVKISVPEGNNIEPFILSSDSPDKVREEMEAAYHPGTSSFDIRISLPDWLPVADETKRSLLCLVRASSPREDVDIPIIGIQSLGYDSVRIYEIVNSQSEVVTTSILVVGTNDSTLTELPERHWKNIVVRCSKEGVLIDNWGKDNFQSSDIELLEERMQSEYQSSVVWEKQKLNAEARRMFAISSRLIEEGRELEGEDFRNKGNALRESARSLASVTGVKLSQRLLLEVQEVSEE